MKSAAIILSIILSISFLAEAQGVFGSEISLTTSLQNGPSISYSEDLDSDGFMDIVVVTREGDRLAWYKNNGFGSFGERNVIEIPIGTTPYIQLYDFDNDADIDIVSLLGNSLGWHENDGNGNFSNQILIVDTISISNNFYVGDLNGDSYNDIASHSFLSGEAKWLLNDGANNYTLKSVELILSNDYRGVWYGDLNNDNKDDLLYSYYDEDTILANSWISFDSLGNFESQAALDGGFTPKSLVDIDSDGDLDIYVFNDSAYWYKNDGTGEFELSSLMLSTTDDIYTMQFADLDNDNDQDIIYEIASSGYIKWLANDGSQSFTEAGFISDTILNWNTIHATDINNDGLNDIISMDVIRDVVFLYRNNGVLGFANGEYIGPLSDLNDPTEVILIDKDNDGDNDLFVKSNYYYYEWFENTNGEALFQQASIPIYLSDHLYTSFIDFDNDGDLDLIGFDDNNLDWAENDGNWNFSNWQNIHQLSALYSYNEIQLFDYDNDGDKDMIIYRTNANDLLLSTNNNGVFSSPTEIYNSDFQIAYQHDRDLLDVNNDGFEDIVSCIPNITGIFTLGLEISWLQNLSGSGVFSKTIIEENVIGGEGVELADFNEDGLIDIVVFASGGIALAWKENLGNSTFGSLQGIAVVEERVTSIQLADINSDGHIDIVAFYLNNLFWYANDGSGNFSAENYILTDRKLSSFSIGDLNGDDFVDVAFTVSSEDQLSWVENLLSDSTSIVTGKVYWDKNEDLVYNVEDIPIQGLSINLQPEGSSFYSNTEGEYTVYVTDAGSHTITISEPQLLICNGPAQFDYNPTNRSYEFDNEPNSEFVQDFILTADYPCIEISGKVFKDVNSNGVNDNGELGLSGILVEVIGEQSTFTGSNGNYNFSLRDDINHTIAINLSSDYIGYCNENTEVYAQTYPLDPDKYQIEVGNAQSLDTFDFGVSENTSGDFDLLIISLGVGAGNKVGKAFKAWMDFKRIGIVTETCTLRIEHDPLISFVNADIPPRNIGSNFVEWVFPPGTAPQFHCMQMDWFLSNDAQEGQVLHWEAHYTCPPLIDLCDYNNHFIREIPVISGPLRLAEVGASLASVRPEGTMPELITQDDNLLSYEITFKNPLPTTAYNVTIIDTLPDDVLNVSTIQKPFGSYPANFKIIDNKILIWKMDGINLSNVEESELNSYGFVQFNVNLKPDLPEGTIIPNKATVWFNGIEPTTTNEVIHRIGMPSNINQSFEYENLTTEIYPNPFNEEAIFTIKGQRDFNFDLEIINTSGQTIRVQSNLSEDEIHIKGKGIPKGLYFVNIYNSQNKERINTLKLIKL